jgi:hypothetical protein
MVLISRDSFAFERHWTRGEDAAMPDFSSRYLDANNLDQTGEGEDTQPPVDKKFLAGGDSWFSIGEMPPATTNIVTQLKLSFSFGVVDRAEPGQELRLMIESMGDRVFNRLLSGRFAYAFDGILISGGGNDLIAAALSPPGNDPAKQLLLTSQQRGAQQVPLDQYISPQGWKALAEHLSYWFIELINRRDSSPENRRKPLFFHNYAYCAPRPAPAAGGLSGPWLNRAMDLYEIPQADREQLSDLLINKLGDALQGVVSQCRGRDPNCNVYLINTKDNANLQRAEPGSRGPSGDWINEIHPTIGGYDKLARVWRQEIEAHIS